MKYIMLSICVIIGKFHSHSSLSITSEFSNDYIDYKLPTIYIV